MTRCLFGAALAAACLTFTACDSRKTNGAKPANGGEVAEPATIGNALFQPAEYRPVKDQGAAADPVTVPMANVVILRKLDMPSRVDGTVQWIGVEITADEAARLKPEDVYHHPRTKKAYRRLLPGDLVQRDQVIAMLDDEQAFIEYDAARIKAEAAQESAVAYDTTVSKLADIVRQTAEGVQRGIIPRQELLNSEATKARYVAERADHQGTA